MKKKIEIIVSLTLMLLLTACGNKKYDFVCTRQLDGVDSVISGNVKDGKITKLTMKFTSEYPSEEEAKKDAESYENVKSTLDGYVISVKVDGKKVILETRMDLTKIPNELLKEQFQDNDLSKNSYLNKLKDDGYICK